MTAELRGSIVALVTPMLSDGRVDTAAYEHLLQFHLAHGTHGLVIGGTTGESPALGADELQELIRIAVRVVDGRIPVIAGSGSSSTATTVKLTRLACEAGADACLVVTPYYNKPTQEGLYQHYSAVASAASVPLILYNVPGRTGTDLLPETAARLAENERIVAIKEATADIDRAREIMRLCGTGLELLSGDDATALALIHAGAKGVISVTANVAPEKVAALNTAALEGDWERAEMIDEELRDLHQAMFIEPNPIPVKYALARMGLIEPGLRLPLTQLDDAHRAAVDSALRRAGINT